MQKSLILILLLFFCMLGYAQEGNVGGLVGGVPPRGLSLWPLLDTVGHAPLMVQLGYEHRFSPRTVGEYHRNDPSIPYYYQPSQGRHITGAYLDASGVLRRSNWAMHGKAGYSRSIHRGVFGSLGAMPQLFYPYTVSVGESRREVREVYSLAGDAIFQHGALAFGAGGSYSGGTHYSQIDPRVRSRVGDLGMHLAVSVERWILMATVQGDFRYTLDALSVRTLGEDRKDIYYYLLGAGLYDHNLSIPQSSFSMQSSRYEGGVTAQLQIRTRGVHTLWGALSASGTQNDNGTLPVVASTRGRCAMLGVGSEYVWGAFTLRGWGSYRHCRRLGYELLYDTVTVHYAPNIVEMREYARTPAWQGAAQQILCGFRLSNQRPWGTLSLYAEGYGAKHSSSAAFPSYGGSTSQKGLRCRMGIDIPVALWVVRLAMRYQQRWGYLHHAFLPENGGATVQEERMLIGYGAQSYHALGGDVEVERCLYRQYRIGLKATMLLVSYPGIDAKGRWLSIALWYALGGCSTKILL